MVYGSRSIPQLLPFLNFIQKQNSKLPLLSRKQSLLSQLSLRSEMTLHPPCVIASAAELVTATSCDAAPKSGKDSGYAGKIFSTAFLIDRVLMNIVSVNILETFLYAYMFVCFHEQYVLI